MPCQREGNPSLAKEVFEATRGDSAIINQANLFIPSAFDMLVQHLCYYLTDWTGIKPRQEDWDTNKVVKCLKGEPIKGYAQVSVAGTTFRLEERNKQEFLAHLWSALGRSFNSQNQSTAIVPIPNSAGVVGESANYKTLLYAQAIAAGSGGKLVALDALRWKAAAGAMHKQAGARSPERRFDNLQVIQKPDRPVVLFDDFITSGSSFIAAVWRLSEVGCLPTEGIAVARRTAIQEPKMFEYRQQDLEIPPKPLF